ncbi:MAG: Rieske 2Fe-2S domain-containing protein [bacterium]|nr:Rieske 2Fe-2S domain-containing protein [bacterium]MDE0290345.1 Rieske 2Fe-2S domain-containing protein [bacterium]MDE0439838.1 Rieske 2Fe-2S domain-containing protein [bacterium]
MEASNGVFRFTAAEHRILAGVSNSTSMGNALRNYWFPACLSEELPEPDSPPVRTKLLGEPLVAFRDSGGAVGLLNEFCPHRGSSLFFGRNADGGLQCLYHGWKFNVGGDCIENPTSPGLVGRPEVAQTAYPTCEAGGIVWAYLGDAARLPPLPDLGYLKVDEARRYVSKRLQPCHWLQALEADIDSSHVPYLHREELLEEPDHPLVRNILEETAPYFEVVDTDYGLMIGARRDFGEDAYYWRVNHWLAPCYTVVPAESTTEVRKIHAWIPIDETTTWVYGLTWHPDRDLTEEELEQYTAGTGGIYAEKLPGTYLAVRNLANDYLVDRAAQSAGTIWSGITGNQEQDDMATASMGPAYDRSKETLVGTDGGVIATRQALLSSSADAASGRPVVGVEGSGYDAPGVSVVLPRDADWVAEIRTMMAGGTSHVAMATGGLDS